MIFYLLYIWHIKVIQIMKLILISWPEWPRSCLNISSHRYFSAGCACLTFWCFEFNWRLFSLKQVCTAALTWQTFIWPKAAPSLYTKWSSTNPKPSTHCGTTWSTPSGQWVPTQTEVTSLRCLWRSSVTHSLLDCDKVLACSGSDWTEAVQNQNKQHLNAQTIIFCHTGKERIKMKRPSVCRHRTFSKLFTG